MQLILLEDAWRELFVLGIAQWAIPVDSATLLTVSGMRRPHRLQRYVSRVTLFAIIFAPGVADHFGALTTACLLTGMNTENTESPRMSKIMSEIQALQEVVTRFRQMRLDATEFACLKCIVTFKAGES